MASLGWVTPGAATEGVTPLFFSWKTWRPFFLLFSRQFCGVIPGFFFSLLLKSWRLFLLIAVTIAFYCFHSGVTPWHLFYLSDLVSPLFFVNLPTKKFFSFRCHTPLEGVTGGGPPSDATGRRAGVVPLFIVLAWRQIDAKLMFQVFGPLLPVSPPRWCHPGRSPRS